MFNTARQSSAFQRMGGRLVLAIVTIAWASVSDAQLLTGALIGTVTDARGPRLPARRSGSIPRR